MVTEEAGAGQRTLPFDQPLGAGDTDAFDPSGAVQVTITDTGGQGECRLELRSVATGEILDAGALRTKGETLVGQSVELDPRGSPSVYVATPFCAIRITQA